MTATRYDAFVTLLQRADPIDLPPRSRQYTVAGDPRRREAIKLQLARAWLSYRQEAAAETSGIISVRRSRLQLARTA